MLNTFIEKIKTDKVYQFGLALFIGILGLKLMVDSSAKKHSATLKADAIRVAAPSNTAAPAKAIGKRDAGYSVTTNRPARGTTGGVALLNRKKTATRAVASSKASWNLNISARAKPRQGVLR